MKTILISYSDENEEFAGPLKLMFETILNNSNIVVKDLNINQEYEILESLNDCDLFIVLLNDVSINKPIINFEIGYARSKEKKVALVSTIDFYSEEIPQYILNDQEITINTLDKINKLNKIVSKELGIIIKELKN